MIKRLLIFSSALLLWGCTESASPTISAGGATSCKVQFLNLAISGDQLLKEITAASEVSSLASYADKQILNASTWCHLNVGDRIATLKVSFYDGSAYKGTLGLGLYGQEKFFLKYHNFEGSKVTCISNDEKDEFMRLIGVSPEEFKRIFPSE